MFSVRHFITSIRNLLTQIPVRRLAALIINFAFVSRNLVFYLLWIVDSNAPPSLYNPWLGYMKVTQDPLRTWEINLKISLIR